LYDVEESCLDMCRMKNSGYASVGSFRYNS